MVGGLGALGALGSFGGGLGQGMDEAQRRRLAALQMQAARQAQSGQQDAGAAIMRTEGVTPPPTSMVPGASPIGGLMSKIGGVFGGGQQPQGAQPPTPLAARGGGPQPPPAQPQAPQMGAAQPQMGAASPGQQPQGQSPVPPALQNAAATLSGDQLAYTLAHTPGMTPQRLMAALAALGPFMTQQNQALYRSATLQIAQQNAQSNSVRAGAAQQTAATGAKREADTDADRKAKRDLEQQRVQTTKDSAYETIDLANQATDLKTKTALLNSTERELSSLRAARSAATDPDFQKSLDAQIADVEKAIAAAKADLQRVPPVPTGNAGAPGGGKTTDRAPQGGRPTTVTVGGVTYRYNGSGDYDDRANWTPVK